MMNIQGFGAASAAYASVNKASSRPQTIPASIAMSHNGETQVSISDQAKALADTSAADIQHRLDAIKQKPAVARSSEDREYIQLHDEHLQALMAKDQSTLSADDVDYMQKASGLVNTMSQLSPKERQLYDELVGKGERQAADGLLMVGMSRMGSGDVTLPGGKTFNPQHTEITADNVRQLFKHAFAGDTGQSDRQFDALASCLDGREARQQQAQA